MLLWSIRQYPIHVGMLTMSILSEGCHDTFLEDSASSNADLFS